MRITAETEKTMMNTKTRLNKFLAECGIASRRKSEEFITEGRVTVNGKTVTQLAFLIDESKDIVAVDGEKIKVRSKLYFLLNKPKGVVTTVNDEKNRKTVVDLINTREKIFPVGRLDYDTTGVLILTNDGEFANFFTHPKNKVPREYTAFLDRELDEKDKQKLLSGIILDGRKSRFTEISFPKRKKFDCVDVVTVEGRNHFVKRMFELLGYRVTALKRKSFGGITVEGLPSACYRHLSKREIEEVINKYGK